MIVQELIALLGLETDTTSFKKGDDSLLKLDKAVTNVAIAAGAMALAVQAATWAMVTNFAEGADATQKHADKIGEDVQALQELQFAAQRSGVAVTGLNTALQRQTRRVSEAAQGTGPTVAALKELGLDAQALNQMKPAEQLDMIADAMNGLGSQSDRVRLAMRLWDTEGVGLVNMIAGGSDALNDLRAQARATGGVFTEDTGREAEKFNDHLLDTQMIMKGIKATISAELLPVFNRLLSDFKEMFSRNSESIINGISKGIEIAAFALELLTKAAIAFVALKFARYVWAIATAFRAMGIAGAVAWLAAVWPAVALGAIIVGLLLLLDDFIAWYRGGESVFGEFFDLQARGWGMMWQALKDGLVIVADFFMMVGEGFDSMIDGIQDAWAMIKQFFAWIASNIPDFLTTDPLSDEGAWGAVKGFTKNLSIGLGDLTGGFIGTTPTGGGNVQQTNQINISGEGLDATAVGEAVRANINTLMNDAVNINDTGYRG